MTQERLRKAVLNKLNACQLLLSKPSTSRDICYKSRPGESVVNCRRSEKADVLKTKKRIFSIGESISGN